MDASNTPLNVSVLGVDDRLRTTLKMFFQGPCKNSVIMAGADSAQACIIDMDGLDADAILTEYRQSFADLPVILLSLSQQDESGAIYVQKPIQAKQMLAALDDVRAVLTSQLKQPAVLQPAVVDKRASPIAELNIEEPISISIPEPEPELSEIDALDSLGIDDEVVGADSLYADEDVADSDDERLMVVFERSKASVSEVHRSAHKAAMHLDEESYANFVGSVPDIDISDPQQVDAAHYDPTKFLQGYVKSAINIARSKNRILRLNSGWKPIVIFPHSHEIWVDADDERMRGFSVVPVAAVSDFSSGSGGAKGLTISPFNLKVEGANQNPEMFQSMDAFMWKLALWSSAGRVPIGIDLNQPVFLRRWPNLTRFVLVPHSIRIAALLMEQPRTLPDVAKALGIRQQYVFSFFSATYALGLASQSKQRGSRMPVSNKQSKAKSSGFLGKILKRLRH